MAITLYSTTFCPYAWAVRIVLHEKGILDIPDFLK